MKPSEVLYDSLPSYAETKAMRERIRPAIMVVCYFAAQKFLGIAMVAIGIAGLLVFKDLTFLIMSGGFYFVFTNKAILDLPHKREVIKILERKPSSSKDGKMAEPQPTMR